MKRSALIVSTLSTVSLLLLTSCASEPEVIVETQYVVNTPAKIAAPTAPKFAVLNNKESLSSTANTKKLMSNLSLLKNYSNALKQTVTYYETEIDRLQKEKETLNKNDTKSKN